MNTDSDFPAPKKSTGKGCLIGCLVAAIGIPILLVLIGYFVVMHSPAPLWLAARVLNTADEVTIKGIGGSISGGFTIDELRMSDEDGNESVLEGLALKWQDMTRLKTSRELIIEEIALERAHLFINTSKQDEAAADDTAESSGGSTTTESEHEGTELVLFEIKKVDIREVVIESTTGDFKLELNKILMEGLRIQDDDLAINAFSIDSNFLDMRLEDAEPVMIDGQSVPFTRRLVGSLKPEAHDSLAREINFSVDMGAMGGDFINRMQLLDGVVEVIHLGKDGKQSMQIEHFHPSDYFSEDWRGLVSDISLLINSEAADPQTGLRTTKAQSGEFTVGTTVFTIEPQVLQEEGPEAPDEDEPSPPIVATSKKGDLVITAELDKLAGPPYFGISLSSSPQRQPKELLALLLFDTPFSDLNPAQRAEVDTAVNKHLTPTDADADANANAKP